MEAKRLTTPDGKFWINLNSDEVITFGGELRSLPVLTVIFIPGDERFIALIDPWDRPVGVKLGLVALEPNGSEVWAVFDQTTLDPFIGIRRKGNVLVANTWSGVSYYIDSKSGEIIDKKFGK